MRESGYSREFVIIFAAGLISALAVAEPTTQPAVAERATGAIIERTNAFRKEEGCGELKQNSQLAQAAQSFAEFMAKTEKYGHDADGRQPADRAKAAGYQICLISENIAYRFNSRGFTDDELAESFVAGWIKSPPHRKNMLGPAVVDIGVGIARSEKGVYYGVQLFGRPESMKIKFIVVNRADRGVTLLVDDQAVKLPRGATMTHAVCEPVRLRLDGGGGDERVERAATFVVSGGAEGIRLERRMK